MSGWYTQAFCKKCERSFGRATFGEIWFTRQDYPVCPDCGCESYYYDTRTVRYVPPVRGPWFKLWPIVRPGFYELKEPPQ